MSNEKKNEITIPVSERFTNAVLKEFTANAGEIVWGPHQKKLAQHLFIKCDQQLNELETKRLKNTSDTRAPIVWNNINMQGLAVDSVHIIELGLDALIPNHISPIPYFNNKLRKYDLNLQISYEGKEFYKRALAIDPPKDIRFELVYSTDEFEPIMKSGENDIETYKFKITNAFDRGEVKGGFGYLIYDDPTKNKLVLVGNKDFEKSEKCSKGGTFWKDWPENMKYKTVVHRVCDTIKIDPKKMTAAVAAVENQREVDFEREVNENANKIPIDIECTIVDTETGEILDDGDKKPKVKKEASKIDSPKPKNDKPRARESKPESEEKLPPF